ncbi:MAG: hypothetical protein OHK0039_21650 [Bacteroidia bacterium]
MLALLPFVWLTACQREDSINVNQDTIYGEYRLVYEAEANKTYARASFKFGAATGTVLELTAPARVDFESESLTWQPVFAYYERVYAGVVADGAFTYADLDSMTFVNQVRMSRPIALPADLDSLSQGAAYSLAWVGDPVGADETVTVTINGINERDAQIFSTKDLGATAIVLDKDKLGRLGRGQGKVFIERWTDQELVQGTSKGGAVWSRYLATPQAMQIVE